MLKEKINLNIPGRNVFSLPRLKKVVINYRVDDARESAESLAAAEKELVAISGQKPRLCRAKKSVASFKLRQGDPLALKVTLRGSRMDDFLLKFINIVLPRLRDFKGMPLNAFDEAGNYNLTIKDQTYFPEIDLNKVNKIRSVQITISIAAKSVDEARMLLSAHGFPFEKQ
jgi:large subunit ribosomal protein L5